MPRRSRPTAPARSTAGSLSAPRRVSTSRKEQLDAVGGAGAGKFTWPTADVVADHQLLARHQPLWLVLFCCRLLHRSVGNTEIRSVYDCEHDRKRAAEQRRQQHPRGVRVYHAPGY